MQKTNDYTWLCSRYLLKGKKYCESANIREKELDYILKDIFINKIIDLSKVKSILLNYYKNQEKSNNIIKILLEEKKMINIKKDKLFELTVSNNISNEEFKERNCGFNRRLKEIDKQLKNSPSNNIEINNLECAIDKIINSDDTFKNLVSLIMDKIVVSSEKNHIVLIIYLKHNVLTKKLYHYSFKRGYNTRGTKRYEVFYKVICKNL